MAKRRIKDAKDLTTGELIYFRGHAKATYLSDGSTLEEKISSIEENIEKGGTTTISITYSDLVDLRNNSELNPGTKYRITDYVTTTSQPNTQSAGHQFDIIVEALSENTLSEDAKAIQNENDEYFDGSNLEAWELKYCLDNDTARFGWAVTNTTVNSENVNIIDTLITDNGFNDPFLPDYYIYIDTAGNEFERYVPEEEGDGMRDTDFFIEYGRETSPDGLENQLCIYKNDLSDENYMEGGEEEGPDYADKFFYWSTEEVDGIIYDKWKKSETDSGWNITDGGGNVFILTQRITTGEINLVENKGKGVIYYMKDEFNNETPYDFKNIKFYREKQNKYVFTFSWINENEDVEDLTLRQDLLSGDRIAYGTHNNIIKIYNKGNQQQLNDVTFVSSYLYDSGFFNGCHSNSLGNNCHSNSFGNNCYSNSLGNNCQSNSLGNGCYSNSLGNGCYSNSLGNNCYSNSLGNNCYYNSLGNYCYYNSFGDQFNYNTFGNYCYNNTFGNYCYSNTFGDQFNYNSLGNYCYNNTFGNYCRSNSFGNDCHSNSLGNQCSFNSFGNKCSINGFYDDSSYSFNEKFNEYIGDDNRLNYVQYVTLYEGCHHLLFHTSEVINKENKVQNITVTKGVKSIEEDEDGYLIPLAIEIPVTNNEYELKIARNSNGDIKMYCEADLIG